MHGVKNDSTLVFNKIRVIFDPPLDGVGIITKITMSKYFFKVFFHLIT